MKPKIIHAVTVSKSLKLMRGQIKYLADNGYFVKVVSSDGFEIRDFEAQENTKILQVEMKREIKLFSDLFSLLKLLVIINKEKPVLINAGTPKAGLLLTIVGYVCRVPIRIYTIRGLRLETTSGIKRRILMLTEKISTKLATNVLAISPSLKDRVVELGIVGESKVDVIGIGSSNGFDMTRFIGNENSSIENKILRTKLGIKENDIIMGYVGRLTRDKGIEELVISFRLLSNKFDNLKLLIVGDFEEGDPVNKEIQYEIINDDKILFMDFQSNPIPYYSIMDIFMFLTKREGFGNVVIEAALMSKPAIVSNVTGSKDTVIDKYTGFLVEPNEIKDIVEKTTILIENPEISRNFGVQAQKWAINNFDSKDIWRQLNQYYSKLLNEYRG